jgi:hypothetical protein
MLCHPVNVARQFADSELFLSNFNRVPHQTDLNQAQKGHAAFVKTFPVFQQATSLIAYCYEIVSYSVNFGHYVPPPFTITINEPLGTLFVSLPSIYQTYSLQTTSGALAEALKNPKTKLITLDSFKSIIAGSDGYRMFRDLVALSGQPSLDPYATLPPAPLQMVDQSILDHLHNWELYLDKLLMHGQWLLDRYFIESFHTSAKPEMRTKFTAQLRNGMKSDCPDIDKPLPTKYYPRNLRTAFVMIARGEYGDQKVASMLVREMTHGSSAMTAPEFDMQALREGLGKGIQCHLCQGYEPHDSFGEGLAHVSGAVSQGDYKCASPLPSASDLGHLSPISVAQVEIFDVTRLAEEDLVLTTFLSDRCFVDRPPPFPGKDIDDKYDKYALDFADFDDDSVSSEQG